MAKLVDEIKVIAKGLRVQALEPKPAYDALDIVADKVAELEAENARLREVQDLHLKTLDQLSAAVKDLRQADEEIERLREAHQELFRLARDVADHVRDTSWNMGAIRRLTRYIDSQP